MVYVLKMVVLESAFLAVVVASASVGMASFAGQSLRALYLRFREWWNRVYRREYTAMAGECSPHALKIAKYVAKLVVHDEKLSLRRVGMSVDGGKSIITVSRDEATVSTASGPVYIKPHVSQTGIIGYTIWSKSSMSAEDFGRFVSGIVD